MPIGVWIALVAVVVALAFGLYRARTDGRFRSASTSAPDGVAHGSAEEADAATAWSQIVAAVPGVERGERATLVQFSSAFCAPCRTTRVTLADVAQTVPGVVHLDVDAEHHLELVRTLDILRTPTTLVLDASGRERTRAAGAPTKAQVLAALPE